MILYGQLLVSYDSKYNTHTHTLTLSLTHAHAHDHTHARTYTRIQSHTLSLTQTRTHSHTHRRVNSFSTPIFILIGLWLGLCVTLYSVCCCRLVPSAVWGCIGNDNTWWEWFFFGCTHVTGIKECVDSRFAD